jgi:hypothetical protein
MRTAVAALLVLLAAVGVGAAARDHRPAPFGDSVVTRSARPASAGAVLRPGPEGSVQLYDPRTAQIAWSYRRPGSAPLRLFPMAGTGSVVTTVVVWDDGMLTGIRTARPAEPTPTVRWHRFVPGLAEWTRERARLDAARQGPLLAPLARGAAFLVPTPNLVMEFTTDEGSIRGDTLPPQGCAYDPGRALALADADLVLLPRPCEIRSTLDAFGPNGRRWQAPTSPIARPVALPGAGTGTHPAAGSGPGLGLWDVPALHPYRLDPGTGRRTGP